MPYQKIYALPKKAMPYDSGEQTMDKHDPYRSLATPYILFIEPLEKPMKDKIVAISRKYDFSNILDLCCGLGKQCVMLDKQGFTVTGIDSSQAMLRKARKISPSAIEYLEKDAGNTHFEANTFDCIILCFSLHEKEQDKREKIIEEAKRLVKPEGKIIIVEYSTSRGYSEKIIFRLLGLIMKIGIRFIEISAGREHYENYKDWTKRELEDMLNNWDLSIIEKERFYFGAVELIIVEPV